MNAEPGAPALVPIAGGRIALRDEGKGRSWYADVAPFQLATIPTTRALYATVLGQPLPSAAEQALPVVDVSWIDAARFCNALSAHEGRTPCYGGEIDGEADMVTCEAGADGYRLPTEAEWELACRAGSNDVRYGELDAIAWFKDNADDRAHPVGTKAANAFGLFDMIGNVWEWCWDVYDPDVYGNYRVFRGGGFADPPRGCRASCRRKSHPTTRIDDLGFRLARSA